jgi:hypothetical protein
MKIGLPHPVAALAATGGRLASGGLTGKPNWVWEVSEACEASILGQLSALSV